MPQPRAVAASPTREQLPPDLRLYALETITSTQDEAITQQAETLAVHDTRLDGHDILLATLVEQLKAVNTVTTKLATSVDKLLFAVIGAALTIATAVTVAGVT